jgi:DsbC/DsbD-like thiol-disulfide interchange protein
MKQDCLFHERLMVYRRPMRSLLLFLAALLATPAFAAATDWQEVGPGARARLISSDFATPDGSTLVAVEIDMPSNTKTYWRVPGETGIPTTFDFSASTGIGITEILWPFPTIDTASGYLDFAYYGPTVLPARLSLTGDQPVVDLSVTMGICSDICIPTQVRFTLPLNLAKPDMGQGLRIDQAVANVPLPAADDNVIGTATLYETGLWIDLAAADIDPASIIAATEDAGVLFGAPQKSRDSGLVMLPLLGGGEQQSLVGQPVQINFMTPGGPYLVVREILAPESTAAAP